MDEKEMEEDEMMDSDQEDALMFDSGDELCEEEEQENDDYDSSGELSQRKVYVPGESEAENSDELECDESAYVLYQQAQTGAPCLSFDIIKDNLGDDRGDTYPQTLYLVAGSQAERAHVNNILVMKMSNLNKSKQHKTNEDDDDEVSSSDSDDEEELPSLQCAMIKHNGCVNRIKFNYVNEKPFAASWSETGSVGIWDLTKPLQAVDNPQLLKNYIQSNDHPKPVFTFNGHGIEGYAVDWSPVTEGILATGDRKKNIHIWKPTSNGLWYVDQTPYSGHAASVEDIQWSPNEAFVLASCSVDKSIRIWDMRARPDKACQLTASEAHDTDINVIHWNKKEPFILSGGDDGIIKVWDLRQFKQGKPVAVFKHHSAPITSLEWHPTDSTVFAASGSDNQISLWDLAIERDDTDVDKELNQLPPQLLFIHQGQKDIKEAHWHPQMPGLIISTALTGFNIFRTISV